MNNKAQEISINPKAIPSKPTQECTKTKQVEEIEQLAHFLLKYAIYLFGFGAYSARIIRCVVRIGNAYGYNVHISIFFRNITLTLSTPNLNLASTYVLSSPPMPLNFGAIVKLSALSWKVHDEKTPFTELLQEFNQIIQLKKRNILQELCFVPLSNASLCKIFGGDIESFMIVLFSTTLTLIFREYFIRIKLDMRLLAIISAFMVSFFASLFQQILSTETLDIAIAASVLFLIPGIHFINATLDILDSHILTGISRGIDAGIIIACIAAGMYLNLYLIRILNVG
ncbi:hypothetical protein CCZ01_03285 [Helicobacter monodelphidis]|uniref:threonine/serine ThrE exporter family protein n=1 Tax=Helicobacter sp. 15-1451 TaxID=2004995 RepID=UPI000DCAFD77|nr:threonine/serine exporter family protein [Helicobacter sp. 15-1451]RAX58116.1 hypothetical protein CCZ01_03285 [Helicobacter sp. 15-1451]